MALDTLIKFFFFKQRVPSKGEQDFVAEKAHNVLNSARDLFRPQTHLVVFLVLAIALQNAKRRVQRLKYNKFCGQTFLKDIF